MPSSRIPNFYDKPLPERAALVAQWAGLTPAEQAILEGVGLTPEVANHMIENVVGLHALPLGVAVNFLVNGRDVLVPMVLEEPSVVASASFMAKLARAGGGFTASTTASEMIGQLQILDLTDLPTAQKILLENKTHLMALADAAQPNIVERGGGARDVEVRLIENSPIGAFLVLHLIFDCLDAMGANTVNTACEALAPEVERLTQGRVHLRILSNLTDRRLARAQCVVPVSELAFGDYAGEAVRDGIIEAYAFAAADPYRAATHNKGIMNGIDPVVIATGNDWRAIEAGAHAYAARNGRYTSLTTWRKDDAGNLVGSIEVPMALGIVGGATKVHPTAQVALKILGVQTARELAEITACVGLAQNMAALRALATEGIQRGHMGLHARQIAVAAGAVGEQVERIAQQLIAEKQIRVERAKEILSAD